MVISSHHKISAIKAGLTSFSKLPVNPEVLSINVHFNDIQDFDGLIAPNLKELDASSNQITSLSGLETFKSLTYLNLACNQLSEIDGLDGLKNLSYLNLSYNKIASLSGFLKITGSMSKLQTLELHGNQISSLSDVILSLSRISSLRHLILSHNEGRNNPVCSVENYRSEVFLGIPQLITLDNKDQNERSVRIQVDDVLKKIGLDLSLTDLDFSSDIQSSSCQMSSPERRNKFAVHTPRIDAVLSTNRTKSHLSGAISATPVESAISSTECSVDLSPPAVPPDGRDKSEFTQVQIDQEMRLKLLENQLANLVSARQEATNNRLPQACSKISKSSSTASQKDGKASIPASKTKVVRGTSKVVKRQGIQDKDTYVNLVKELESERERRWKSEQAAKKLAEIVRNLNAEKMEGKSLHDMAAQTADKLKQALIREKEHTEKIKTDILIYKEKVAEISDELVSCRRTIEEQQTVIEKMELEAKELAENHSKTLADQSKRLHDAEIRASRALREADMQKSQNLLLEKSLSSLQDSFCKLQQDHKIEKDAMFTADSAEFKNALSKEIHKIEKRHQEEIKTLKQIIATLRNQYAELEDEFRQALHIEAERFAVVSAQGVSSASELEKYQSLYRKLKDKEDKCQSIITQLTSVAKEQKLKIAELSNNKRESHKQFEEQISKLEVVAENGRRNGVQLELIKQEKSRLVSQLAALQSVVDGLRDERKLWGHELAQQGASLAQDRGRLESRIDSLQQEIMSLRKQNERDLDTLKIKTKIVDDQTDTIHKMKQALLEKDQEVVHTQEESLEHQKKIEEDVELLTQDNAVLNEQIATLLDRKKELKQQLADSEKELDDLKQSHSKLVKKWSEKGQVLSQLEKQVKQMKETYEKRAQGVAKERDEALEAKMLLTERLSKADSAFREQLEAASAAHQQEMTRVIRNNENEMGIMKKRVISVEEEMREVLRDADRQKKALETKLRKATSVFTELQKGFE